MSRDGGVRRLAVSGLRSRLGRARRAIARAGRTLDQRLWELGLGRENQARLRALRGRYAGRRCWVLANGPSLVRTDVRLLKDETTIGSNALFLMFDYMGYKPTFLTVEDQLVAEDRAPELNAVRGTTKIFPRDLSYCLTRDPDTVFVHFVRQYPEFPRFSPRLDRVVYWGGTVSMLNLALAYYLGCNPIYLIGFDHSYKVPANLSSDVIVSDRDDVNHFHPDYFGKGYRYHDPGVERMEAGYRVAWEYLRGRGISVFNATDGGKLEVFPRMSFTDVIASG